MLDGQTDGRGGGGLEPGGFGVPVVGVTVAGQELSRLPRVAKGVCGRATAWGGRTAPGGSLWVGRLGTVPKGPCLWGHRDLPGGPGGALGFGGAPAAAPKGPGGHPLPCPKGSEGEGTRHHVWGSWGGTCRRAQVSWGGHPLPCPRIWGERGKRHCIWGSWGDTHCHALGVLGRGGHSSHGMWGTWCPQGVTTSLDMGAPRCPRPVPPTPLECIWPRQGPLRCPQGWSQPLQQCHWGW